MTPPEVILDRYLKATFHNGEFRKLDIEKVEPPSLRKTLYALQYVTNEDLRMENSNASGGVEHPPFHFDYLEAPIKNALAIPLESYWFIVVGLPMVEAVLDISRRLGESQAVLRLLRLDTAVFIPDVFQDYLSQIQISFLTAHEYAHLIHGHVGNRDFNGVWTELAPATPSGNLDLQAEELIADGYAAYLGLAFLLRSELRERIVIHLGQREKPSSDCNELIMSCFFLAVMAYFRTIWPESIKAPFEVLKHPPAPVRIDYLIQVVKMWCGQFGCVAQSWLDSPHLNDLFHVAAGEVDSVTRQGWDAQISLLSGEAGIQYRNLLFEKSNKLRRRE
jgi:hypothetical protein